MNEFVSHPENLPERAAGLSGSIRKVGIDCLKKTSPKEKVVP